MSHAHQHVLAPGVRKRERWPGALHLRDAVVHALLAEQTNVEPKHCARS